MNDELQASQAEAEQLRKQGTTLQGQLDAAQAKLNQQQAALVAAQQVQSTLQVRVCTHYCSSSSSRL